MKYILRFIAVILLPLITIIAVNKTGPAPTNQWLAGECTRYCHNHSCLHKPEKSIFDIPYETTIYWLKNNAFGLSYKQMNILVFVVAWPGLLLFLLMFICSNHFILQRLKRSLK